MSDDVVDQFLDACRAVTKTESVEHWWKDGVYQGAIVRFTNPLHPDLKEVFYPYLPLTVTGVTGLQPTPKATREYFIQHGWPVPGEPPPSHH